jgi:hypothetical protein
MVDAIVALLDAGAAAGYVEIRSGSQPATAMDAASGVLLATITLNDPVFTAAASGTATADASPALTAAAVDTGTAGWFRGYDSDDNAVIDGSATATGGGGDMQLNTVSLVSAVDVTVTAWTITMPAA